jgi:hypothetical protein
VGDSNCFFARCDRHWNIHDHARERKKIVRAPVLELACGGVMLQDRTQPGCSKIDQPKLRWPTRTG